MTELLPSLQIYLKFVVLSSIGRFFYFTQGCCRFKTTRIFLKIVVGRDTNVQDNATIHTQHDAITNIGCCVTIGHNAVVHGCTIEDNVMIGMGAIILDNAYIERDVIIAAGAVVTQGKKIPTRSLVMGTPGKIVRLLTQEEINAIHNNADEYVHMAELYKLENIHID